MFWLCIRILIFCWSFLIIYWILLLLISLADWWMNLKISDQAAAAENQQRTKDDRKRNNKNKRSISSISSINISSTCCGSSEAMVHRAADHAETKRSKRLKFSLSSSLMYSRNHSLIVSSPFSSHFYHLDITIANRKSQASNIITKKPDNGLYQI